MPKVSVIIPVYNVEQYLRECMDSVINQTLKDIEIICINDGSTDNSLSILKEYAKDDTRIKIINKQNTGYGHSMNVGLDNAQGEYVGIVEPDDFIDLSMYEELYNTASKYDIDFVKSDFYRFTGSDECLKLSHIKPLPEGDYYNKIINPKENIQVVDTYKSNWSGIYKREFMEKYHIRHNETPGASYQDTGFHFQLFTRAERIYFLDKPFYYYRIDNANSSRCCGKKVYYINKEYELMLYYLNQNSELKEIFAPVYWRNKFRDYTWTYNRIDIKYKKEFLKVFSEEFKKAIKNKEPVFELLRPYETERLQLLIKNPVKFYRKTLNRLSLTEKIFSVKNLRNRNRVHKIVRICGLKLKFRNKAKEREIMAEEQKAQLKKIMRERDFIQNHGINRDKVLYDIHNFKQSGVNENSDIIVSLTSYPGRMYDIHYSLYSLLTQTMKPKKVVLWLSEEEFPNKEADLGKNVLDLQKNGLSIEWIKYNFKSFNKLIPVLKKYPNNIIITADDDIYYRPDSIEKLYDTYISSGCKYIIANRCHKAEVNLDKFQPYKKWEKCIVSTEPSFSNFLTGVGMVLYPPNSLYKDVLNEEDFMELAPDADDVWFWAMALLKGTKIRIPNEPNNYLLYTNPYRELSLNTDTTLWASNKFANDLFLDNISKKYPQIMDILNQEALSGEDIRQDMVIQTK